MKVKVKTEKGVVEKLRKIRDKMNLDMQDMSFEEIKQYPEKMRKENTPHSKQ